MRTVNSITVIGYLGCAPELKFPEAGKCPDYYELNIATNHPVKRKDGTYGEEADWHTARSFNSELDIVLENLKKGSRVAVEGEMRYFKYVNKDKATVTKAYIYVKNIIDLNAE